MPITFGALLGVNANPGTTTLAITTLATATVGQRVMVDLCTNGTALPTSVVDSAGNTYTQDSALATNGALSTVTYSCAVATQLNAGGTITATYAASSSIAMEAESWNGIATGTFLRTNGSSTGSASSTTNHTAGTTGSGPQIGDLHRGAFGWSGGTSPFTAGGTYTALAQQGTTSSSPLRSVNAAYKLVTAAGAQTATATTGGSRTSAAASVTYIPAAADTTPPTLSSSTPANGATGVSTSLASISATFSEAVVASAGHVSVSGGVTGALSGSGTSTLTFSITSGALAPATTYTVTLSSSITDAAGNAYAGSTFAFTTESAPTPASTVIPAVLGLDDTLSVALLTAPGGQHLVEAVLPIEDVDLRWNAHGPASCSFFLRRTLAETAYLYDRAALPWVEVSDRGGRIWAGRLEDVAIVAGGVACTALGGRAALDDVRYTAFWSSTQVSAWREVSDAELATRTPTQFTMDTDDRLFIGLKKNATYTNNQIGQLTFETPPGNSRTIVALDLTYRILLPNATWRVIVFIEDRVFSGSTAIFTLSGTGALQTGSQTLTFAATPGARLSFLVQYNNALASSAITGEDGAYFAELTSIRVRSVTQATVSASDIAGHIIGLTNAANPGQLQATTALIQSPGLDLRDETYLDADMADVLNRLVQLGDTQTPPRRWEWGIDLDRRLYLRPRGANARQWIIDAAELPEITRTISTLVTSLYPVYQTPSNRRQVGTAAQNAKAEARWGIRRERALTVQTTSATQATVHRDAALADAATNTTQASVPIPALYDLAGARYPGWACQPGDTVTIQNLPAFLDPALIDRIRTFTVEEVRWSSGRAEVTPEQPIPTIETLLARQDAGLR